MRLPLKVATLAMTASVSVAALSGATIATADAAATDIYKNCTALHGRYPHGVGRTTARDRTSGRPVTTFKHSATLYNRGHEGEQGTRRRPGRHRLRETVAGAVGLAAQPAADHLAHPADLLAEAERGMEGRMVVGEQRHVLAGHGG